MKRIYSSLVRLYWRLRACAVCHGRHLVRRRLCKAAKCGGTGFVVVPEKLELAVDKDADMAWGVGGLYARLGIEAKQIL